MIPSKHLSVLHAGLMLAVLATGSAAHAQPADSDDAALAYAQCMRDNGYAEFPDPTPGKGMQFLINPETAPRFHKAAAACRDLAPAGLGNEAATPEQLDALVKLSQCVRENGLPDFPDPGPQGSFDLGSTDIGPGDARLEKAMAACAELAAGSRIVIGG
jgi:hypothetical protein